MNKKGVGTTTPEAGVETSVQNAEELISQLTSIEIPEDGFENPTPEQTFANNHKQLSDLWNKHYKEQFALGELLCQQHDYLAAKGPGGQWAAYCKRIGIPLSTANDYRNAYTGAMANTPKEAHAALAATGVNLFGAKAAAELPTFNKHAEQLIKEFSTGDVPETYSSIGINSLSDALKMAADSFKKRLREPKVDKKITVADLKDMVLAVVKKHKALLETIKANRKLWKEAACAAYESLDAKGRSDNALALGFALAMLSDDATLEFPTYDSDGNFRILASRKLLRDGLPQEIEAEA